MTNIVLMLFSLALFQTALPQNFFVSGTIRDEAGKPVGAALVREFKSVSGSATFTDTFGFFNLAVSKYPKLSIRCKGYNDTIVNVTDKEDVLIILSTSNTDKNFNENAANHSHNSAVYKNLLQDAISTQTGINNNYVYGGGVRNYTGSLMPVFSHKEETRGSRYLFNEWVHGFALNTNDSIFNTPGYLFNYDKLEGELLLTPDKQSAIAAGKNQVKSFTLYTGKDDTVIYESIPSIDYAHFVKLISTGKKYKIYKLTLTKFVKSDYHTNGMSATGNQYDEFIDEDSYFVITIHDNTIRKLKLNKKWLNHLFAGEASKLSNFFMQNGNAKIDELFLKKIGDCLNN